MGDLEKILVNAGKGFATGITAIADPVGATVAGVDYGLAGIGPSDKARNNDTVYNHVYETLYSDHGEEHKAGTGYIPRFVGNVLGGGGAIGLGYLMWTGFGAAAALAIPVVTGVYGLIRGGLKYYRSFRDGEKIGDNFEKGSFLDGYKFGWHSETSFLASIAQPVESTITGRGYDNSHFKGAYATKAARGARRNFSSMLGTFVGRVVGNVVNSLSMLIFPIYKTVVDSKRCINKEEPGEEYSPTYVRAVA